MANKPKGFVVVVGKRKSGSPFWLVRGTKDRRQIRREFDNRHDALAFAEQSNSTEALGARAEVQALTRLPLEELRHAEAVWLHLERDFPSVGFLELLDFYRALHLVVRPEEAGKAAAALKRIHEKFPDADLASVADWFATNYRAPSTRIPLRTALEHYLTDAERRRTTRTLSEPQYLRIGYAMSELEQHFGGDTPLAHLTTGRLADFLKATTKGRNGAPFSNKSWNNRRGYISAFLEYCRQERWLENNPAGSIRAFRKKDLPPATPVILTLERAQQVMDYAVKVADGRLVPFFALCLFAGIRPDYNHGEISKLEERHFNLDAAELKIPAEISKTRRARIVKLQPNLIRWLERYPLSKNPIICRNFRKLYLKARRALALEHDVLRHTYCSMVVGQSRSVADAALQAGNSEGVIWANYLALVSREVAERFWSICPPKG
jgi:site-specific recombinase XerD